MVVVCAAGEGVVDGLLGVHCFCHFWHEMRSWRDRETWMLRED